MIRILFFLQQAFSLWMLVDAIRRGSRTHWYFVVMLPFGEWVYFFMVKIHDPEFDPVRAFFKKLTTKPVTLSQLRYQLQQRPSCATHLALAQALYDRKAYGEAKEHFAQALQLHDGDREALFGLALSQIELADYTLAIENLFRLKENDPTFRDYAVWRELAHALTHVGRKEEAFELLDTLVVKSPRLGHRVLHARYLLRDERREKAREELKNGLIEYEQAPKFIRSRDRGWARHAKKMLKEAQER
jgi:hypothetical protein